MLFSLREGIADTLLAVGLTLYDTAAVGMPKAELARMRLAALNPELQLQAHQTELCAANVKEIFDKWDLPYACVGEVTDDGLMRVLNHGRLEVEIPADKLANDGPLYRREAVADPPVPELRIEDIPAADLHESLVRLLADPTIASKN